MTKAGRAVGIDLGTTNSVVAVIDRDGAPRILTTDEGSTTLPSLVWFSPKGPVIGEAAREIQLRHIRHCLKADPAYGEGIARALGIAVSEAG